MQKKKFKRFIVFLFIVYQTQQTVAMTTTTRKHINPLQAQALFETGILGNLEDENPKLMNLVIDATEPFMPSAGMRGRVLHVLNMIGCKDKSSLYYDFPGREKIAICVRDFGSGADVVLLDDTESSDGHTAEFRFQTSSALTSQGLTAPAHVDTGTTPKATRDTLSGDDSASS